jgi:hypothetical protein
MTDPEHEELVFVLDYGQGYLLTRRRGPMTMIGGISSHVCSLIVRYVQRRSPGQYMDTS